MSEIQPDRSAVQKQPINNPIFWVVPLYLAQGLPYGVVQLMGPVYFTAMGAPLAVIGLTSLLGLPWNLKLLWSPLADLLGRRRVWVTTTILMLVGAIALVAATSEGAFGQVALNGATGVPTALLVCAGALLLVALLSATADISQDAFYMDALDEKGQALHVGTRVAAYRVAMLTASGLLVYIAGRAGWTVGFGLAAAFMALFVAGCLITLPRPEQKHVPYTGSEQFFKEYGRAFFTYVQRPRPVVVLSFILTYKLGEMMLGRMSTPFFMNECGVTTQQMGMVSGVFGTGASIIGAIVGSIVIARLGMWVGLVSITIAMNGTNLLYIGLAMMDAPSLSQIIPVHGIEHFSGGLGSAAFAFFLMRTCSESFRASHYAVATGLMSVTGTLVSSVSGFIAQDIGYPWFFVLCTLCAVPGTALLFALPRDLAGRSPGDHNPGFQPDAGA